MGQVPTVGDEDAKRRDARGQTVFSVVPPDDQPDDQVIPTQVDQGTQVAIASGSSFELFAGLIGAVVAVMGLTGAFPLYMAAIATIAVGFALLAQGGTLAARWENAVHIEGSERTEAVGIGTEVFGGLAAITLGGLALFGVAPAVVLPVAAAVLGAALMFGGPAQPQIAQIAPSASHPRWRVTRDAVRTSGGVMVMAGLAAIILGVLALTESAPVFTLTLIALLCVAAALVLAGGALTARFARRFA